MVYRKMRNLLIVLAVLFIFNGFPEGSTTRKSVRAIKLDDGVRIKIDGKLDEEVWKQSQPTSDFVQHEPSKGNPASFKTEVRVIYGVKYIYFGVTCYDPEPGKIVARVTKREGNLFSDDCVALALDTFKDHQTAYIFYTNLIGSQMDARIADNGRTFDDTWDGEWLSAGSKNSTGWTAEIAIRYDSLKYIPGKDKEWGMGFIRFIPRKLEVDTWSHPVETPFKVSQFGSIKGLNLPKSQKSIQLIPHVISKLEKGKETKIEAGIDVRYAFSQSVSADLTVNPDFATVEADQEELNLTRFELSLKEKRNFFLEGSEIYNQRIRLFYSRRISDIYGGVKLYGKTRSYEFALMSAQAKNRYEDGEEGPDSSNFSVMRFRKRIFGSSNIGLLVANKLVDGKMTGNAGLDLVHFFTDRLNVTGQLAFSYGDYNKRNLAFFIRPSYDSARFHAHLRYTHLGENFADNANALGFVRDDDRHELDSAVATVWYIKRGWLSGWLERIDYGSNYNIYWSTRGGILRSWQIDQSIVLDFTNKVSLEIEYSREFKRYEKEFHNHMTEFELGYNTREWQSAIAKFEFGKSFDSNYIIFGGEVRFKLGKKFSVEYELDRLHLDPDPENESTWLHVVRLNHYFSKDLYLKAFFQSHSVIDKQNVQVVFVYRFQPPFGTLQLAYQRGTARFGERGSQGDTLFLKFSYVL